MNNNLLSNNNTSNSHCGASEPPISGLAKDLKLDVHPDIQLQQMQAATVMAQKLAQQHSCVNNNNSSGSNTDTSSTENVKNEKKLAAISANSEKVQSESKATKSQQQILQQQQKNHQQNCRAKVWLNHLQWEGMLEDLRLIIRRLHD